MAWRAFPRFVFSGGEERGVAVMYRGGGGGAHVRRYGL